jgi:hypothetical protein
MGVAYVGLARTHPGHCEVMFRADVIRHDDPAMNEAGLRAYGALESAVREVLAAKRSTVPLTDAVSLCWSAMQGIVQLESSLRNVAELKGRDPSPPKIWCAVSLPLPASVEDEYRHGARISVAGAGVGGGGAAALRSHGDGVRSRCDEHGRHATEHGRLEGRVPGDLGARGDRNDWK